MNGNFEIDKGAYPYSAQRIGETYKLVHMPTQRVVFDLGLPSEVVVKAGLILNTLYHSGNTVGLHQALETPKQLMLDAAEAVLSGPQLDQASFRITTY